MTEGIRISKWYGNPHEKKSELGLDFATPDEFWDTLQDFKASEEGYTSANNIIWGY